MRLPGSVLALLLVLAAAVGCDAGPATASTLSPSPPATSAPISATPVVAGTAQPAPSGVLPNHSLTPGEAFAGVTAQQICVSGYAGRARNVLRDQYVQVYASYGIPYPEPSGAYELDHLVPLELGGDNSNRNLWPEAASPVPGFPQKDQLENYLHDAVCGGRMPLADAQAGIAADWLSLYRRYLQP